MSRLSLLSLLSLLALSVLACPRERAPAADTTAPAPPSAPALASSTAFHHEGDTSPAAAEVVVRERDYMGTYVTISVAAPRSPEVEAAIETAYVEVERLAALLSEWSEDSEISAVNQQAGGKPVVVGPELFAVIQAAHQVSADTGGAFDITFHALGGLWDFKSYRPELPQPDEIARRVALVDYRKVELDAERRSVFLVKKGMKMGLGGIAKGFIVDGASAILKAKGYPNHLVTAGGDLYASGTKGARKWRIGVRDPKDRGMVGTIEVQDEGLATSGNYEKFFVKDGVRYHHILDPKTGMPARGLSSVTVLAPSAMLADAYATAVFVLGPEQGLAAARAKGFEVLCFTEEFQRSGTPGIEARIEPLTDQVPTSAPASAPAP